MDRILAVLKTRRNLAAAIAVSAALLAGAVVLGVSLGGGESIAAMSQARAGGTAITVCVVEGYSEAPIEGAAVVVVETGEVYQTDASGHTGLIEVPMIRDARYDKILPKPWGEITLIIYKEGFMPYALFYLQVLENERREGVKILLFEQGVTTSDEPFSIIEGPARPWVNELIRMHAPDSAG